MLIPLFAIAVVDFYPITHQTSTPILVLAIMQNMIFDSAFEVDSVLENKSEF